MEAKINSINLKAMELDREEFFANSVEAVIFDFDGLLVDTEACMFKAWEALMQPYNVTLSEKQVAGLVGSSAPATFLYDKYRHISGQSTPDSAIRSQLLTTAYEIIATINERDGVRSYLDFAKQNGMKIGLATSSEQAHYLPILQRLKLGHYFDCFIGAEEIPRERRKPEPDVYLSTLEQLGVSANKAIAFDDSPPGVMAAKLAGIPTVAVTNSLTRHLDVSSADLTLSSMSEFPLPQLIHILSEKLS